MLSPILFWYPGKHIFRFFNGLSERFYKEIYKDNQTKGDAVNAEGLEIVALDEIHQKSDG